MATTLQTNYPDKQILPILEEEPAKLDFIAGYDTIKFQPLADALAEFKPDVFISLDGNNYERFSRHDGDKIRQYLSSNNTKTVIIDHHEPDGKDITDVYINQNWPACVADVYDVCFERLHLNMPPQAAETTMLGLYADSGGFAYLKDGTHRRIFELIPKLLDLGANVEAVKNQLNQYDSDDVMVLSALFANTTGEQDYTYSFLTDQFVDEWLARGKTYAELQIGTNAFLNEYIRNIDGRQWGFMVYKNKLQGDNMYSVSFRSVGGVKDVAELAVKLGGGGHKPAAGAKFEAASLDVALAKAKQTING
jgi:phosphoesterase RecJ-like protein